jgi:SAM-dependent methyltransferase
MKLPYLEAAHMGDSVPRELPAELERIYAARFSGIEPYRSQVWTILASKFFSQWIKPNHSVLDLGCGYGEFINNVTAAKKFAMDLNPAAEYRIDPDVVLLKQDCSVEWPLESDSLDVVFSSNFFEHLPGKPALQATLRESYRCLRAGGRIIALGPNVKLLSGKYWDFFDHHLPLTELALGEAMLMSGFVTEKVLPKFLPYTMAQGFRPPIWTLRAYLKLPIAWKFLGRQFLVIGQKLA